MLKFLGFLKSVEQPIARGPRILLRPLHRDDLRKVKAWFRDREMIRLSFGLTGDDYVLDQIARDYLREIVNRLSTGVAIATYDGAFIGFIRYTLRNDASSIARLGIMIGERGLWGKGIGTEAVQVLLRHLFEKKGIDKVELDTAEFNGRALRCFEKCGFVKKGQTTDMNFLNGEFSHKVFMTLEKRDFRCPGAIDTFK